MSGVSAEEALLTALHDLLDRLSSSAGDIVAAAGVAPRTGGTPNGWTTIEVVGHLHAVEVDVWQVRLRSLEVESDPWWDWTEPGTGLAEDAVSLDELCIRFSEARTQTVATLRHLDPTGWQRTGRHATFGALDVAGLMERALEHDLEHLRGLRAAIER